MSIQQRAYSQDQKLQRRDDILNAAATLFEQRRYEQITMDDIAKIAGVSKGTLYVYFRTKESIFLEQARQKIDLFFGHLLEDLQSHQSPIGVDGIVNALARAYKNSEGMTKLLSVLHQVLEYKAGFDCALAFRQALLPLLKRAGEECERHLWFIAKGNGQRLLLSIHAMSLGIQQLAEPSPDMKRVEEQPGMELYRFDFGPSFLTMLDCLLIGMETRARKARTELT